MSPTISPNSVESSSLIGASRDAGRIDTVLSCEILPLARPTSSASSSSVGSRPEFFTHLQRDAAHLGNLVNEVNGQADRLALIRPKRA
jgi:hypothetical protein